MLLRRSQLVSSKGSVYHRVESPHIANSRISVERAPGHISGRSQEYNLKTQFVDLLFNLSILPLLLISLLTLSINKVTKAPIWGRGMQSKQDRELPAPPPTSPHPRSLQPRKGISCSIRDWTDSFRESRRRHKGRKIQRGSLNWDQRQSIFTSLICVAAAQLLIIDSFSAAKWRQFSSAAPNLILKGKAFDFTATIHFQTAYLSLKTSWG